MNGLLAHELAIMKLGADLVLPSLIENKRSRFRHVAAFCRAHGHSSIGMYKRFLISSCYLILLADIMPRPDADGRFIVWLF